jgi:hypothetical protein
VVQAVLALVLVLVLSARPAVPEMRVEKKAERVSAQGHHITTITPPVLIVSYHGNAHHTTAHALYRSHTLSNATPP